MTCHAARRSGEFERRLGSARGVVRRALDVADAELAGLERHEAGELLDDAARETARGLLARLEGRDRQALDEIAAAEARLAAGTFGVCEGCARPIGAARLRALPTARRCVACERAAETDVRV